MSGLMPVQLYALRIPPGDFLIPAVPKHAATVSVTMASIDPSEEPDTELVEDKPKRSTLKVVRLPFDVFDDEDSEDDSDFEDVDSDEESGDSEEDVNGGPSDPKKTKKSTKTALLEALAADDDEDMADEDDEDEEDSKEEAKASKELAKIMKSDKGKEKVVNGEGDSEDDEDDDESDESLDFEPDEVVVCTLDPTQHYQQALNITVGEGEKVFFQVSGTHTVHLTGNYMMPLDEPTDDERYADLMDEADEDEYDLSPNEDELDGLDALVGGDSESDDLDDLEDPRVEEVDSEADEVPKLIKHAERKDVDKVTKKRPAPSDDSDDETSVDLKKALAVQVQKEQAAKVANTADPKVEAATNGETKKLSKAEKKRQKKLKNNEGEAAPAPASPPTADATKPVKKEGQQPNGTAEKKVQFAKNLEQGPSSSPATTRSTDSKPSDSTPATTSKVSNVQGITVDVREEGTGPAARKGSRVEMRYIGKLANGKVFDSNKSGKPFSFQLGKGEVIKGWDIGLEGIKVGGQRRLVIPAKHAYGNKEIPGIPKNSELTFDVKCLAVK